MAMFTMAISSVSSLVRLHATQIFSSTAFSKLCCWVGSFDDESEEMNAEIVIGLYSSCVLDSSFTCGILHEDHTWFAWLSSSRWVEIFPLFQPHKVMSLESTEDLITSSILTDAVFFAWKHPHSPDWPCWPHLYATYLPTPYSLFYYKDWIALHQCKYRGTSISSQFNLLRKIIAWKRKQDQWGLKQENKKFKAIQQVGISYLQQCWLDPVISK